MTDIEREIQERVAFKLNDVLSAVTEQANREFNRAFDSTCPVATANHKALTYLKQRIKNEIEMPLPYDQMAEEKFKAARNQAVSTICGRLISRGDRAERNKTSIVVNAVEKAMRW